MKRVAIGVLTLNHPEVVEEVLSLMAPIYQTFGEFGLDVYYFDSSNNDETEKIVLKYRNEGCGNLYYRRMDSEIEGEEKVFSFFHNVDMADTYDYYWLVKDRVAFDLGSMLKVYQAMCMQKYDVIVLDGYGKGYGSEMPTREYTDPTEFYRDFGWIIPSMDATIYRHTLLDVYDWDESGSYRGDEYLHDFMHYNIVFTGLAKLESPCAYVIHYDDMVILSFASANTHSGWIKETFLVWKKLWVEVNDNLPSIYDLYKDEVIRGKALPTNLLSEEGMRELKQLGALTSENVDFVLDGLERVTDVPKDVVKRIAFEESN